MELNKKYTMEEFEEMFNKAMKETIDELEKDYDEACEENNKKDNEIEKITMRAGLVGSIDNKLENLDINIMAVEDKINEIIDHINGSDKE